jgi:chromosome segregation ATPase
MVYTPEKKEKISKYCYRMNKACNNKDISKVSEYFNHLKHHVMIGGATPEEVQTAIEEINNTITKINSGVQPIKQEIETLKATNTEHRAEIEKLNIEIQNKDTEIQNMLGTGEGTEKAIQQLTNEKTTLEQKLASLTKILKSATIAEAKTNAAGDTEAKAFLDMVSRQIEEQLAQIKTLEATSGTSATELAEAKSQLLLAQTSIEQQKAQLEEVTKENADLTSSFDTVGTQLNAIKDSLTKLNDAVEETAVPTASSVTASTASAVPKAAASTETLSTMNIEAFNSLMGYNPTTTEDKQNFITKLEKLKATGTSTEEDKNRIVRIEGKITKLNTL